MLQSMGSQSQTRLSDWTEPSFLLSFGLGLSGFCQYQTGRKKVRGKLMSGNQAKHLVAPTTRRPHLLCWEHSGPGQPPVKWEPDSTTACWIPVLMLSFLMYAGGVPPGTPRQPPFYSLPLSCLVLSCEPQLWILSLPERGWTWSMSTTAPHPAGLWGRVCSRIPPELRGPPHFFLGPTSPKPACSSPRSGI